MGCICLGGVFGGQRNMDLKKSREFRKDKNTLETGAFRYPLCKVTSLRYGHHNPVTE
jgi:hypothetical protein